MTNSCFIAVFNKSEYRKDTYIKKFDTERQVLDCVADLEQSSLERVFRVDEFGEVEFYQVVFNKKLKLKKVEK